MPEPTNQQVEEKVDHAAEARAVLPPRDALNGFDLELCLQAAQVHATLAQVEQLERLNETLGGLLGGGTDKYLKVRNG